jgi:hypothetical protein
MTLRFVICGPEHSGSTLLSDIFRQVPELDSGFEVGVLLCKSPREFRDFQPFYRTMLAGWKIEPAELEWICETDDFSEFYSRLMKTAKALKHEVKEIFDKTPRYFVDILACHEKVKVPFVVIYKDPRAIVFSDFKRAGKPRPFMNWYKNYRGPKIDYLRHLYQESYLKWKSNQDSRPFSEIICLSLEELCLNTRPALEKIFRHVGLEFKIEYLLLDHLRYPHTRADHIVPGLPFEYLKGLASDQIALIKKDFRELGDWFYS